MRAAADDLTASARIRGAATRLFAERGFAATSIRDIAAEAGVSSSLVIHHFKTKALLKAATDARLVAVLAEMFAELPSGEGDFGAAAGLVGQMFHDEPELIDYLRRMLVDGGDAAFGLFTGLVDETAAVLAAHEATGVVLPSADERTRAVFLLVNDLGAVLLRDLVHQALGVDPLSPEGLRQWGAVVMDVYTRGIYRPPPTAPGVGSATAGGEGRGT